MKKNNSDILPILNLITGPMFSGKTDFLIKNLRHHLFRHEKIIIFKPKTVNVVQVDELNSSSNILKFKHKIIHKFVSEGIMTHNNVELPAIPIKKATEILKILEDHIVQKSYFRVIAIDEAHFFDLDLINVIEKLLEKNYIIWISGLNKGFCDNNLKVMNQILSMADNIFKFNAICDVCHKHPATKTQAVDKKGNAVTPDQIKKFVGGKEKYQPRCRLCYQKFSR